MVNKVLFLYKTPRKKIYKDYKNGVSPDTILYGANHIERSGLNVKLSDKAFSKRNPFLWLFYPVQLIAGKITGIGFKLDQAITLLPLMDKNTVIVSTMDTAGLPILLLKKLKIIKSRIIYISIQMAQMLNNKGSKFPFNLYKNLLTYADAIICYSQKECETLKKINKKTYFIPPGTDVDYYSLTNSSKHKKAKLPQILSFGWDINRDFETFTEAIKGKEVKGVIVTGKENTFFFKKPANIKIYYDLAPKDLRSLIFESDIVVIPVKKVNWPAGQLSTLDALAAKKAVIIADLPALTDTFGLKNGVNCFTYIPENTESLSRQIDFLLQNPQASKKISQNGYLLAKNYSTKVFANKLSDIIKHVEKNEKS